MKNFFSKRSSSTASLRAKTRSQHSLTKQIGVTLLESLLALAIASSVIVLSLKVYYSVKKNADIQKVSANVDMLFVALSQYYRANCGTINYDSTGADVQHYYAGTGTVTNPGALYTTSTPSSTAVLLSSLISTGYFNSTNLTYTPLIAGYVLQFNPSSQTTSTFNTRVCTGTSPSSVTCTNQINDATTTPNTTDTSVLIWNAQVAVQLNVPASQMTAYKKTLGADCISSVNGAIVTPCNQSPTPGNYLVWSRLASDPSPKTMDSLWTYMPYVKQFNLQYTHDQFYELNNKQYNSSATFYYTCGG